MPVCTFFGHRDCSESMRPLLKKTVEKLIIEQNVQEFLVGHQGNFDKLVYGVLQELQAKYNITFSIVLAYFPPKKDTRMYPHSLYPEGAETVPPKFAIDYRNRYMLKKAAFVITYITRDFGTGAAKYAAIAQKQQKRLSI